MTGPDFLTYFYIYFCLCLITVSDDLSMMWCLIGTVILWMYCINIIVKFFQWSQIVYRIGRSRGGWIACCPVIYIYTHPRFVRKGRTELSTKHVLKQICCLLCLIKMSFSWNFFDRIAKDWSPGMSIPLDLESHVMSNSNVPREYPWDACLVTKAHTLHYCSHIPVHTISDYIWKLKELSTIN